MVRRATAKRADQRYPSALAFRDALVAAIGELPTPVAFAELLGKLLPPDAEARVARKKLLAKGLEDLARQLDPSAPPVTRPSVSTPAPPLRAEPVTNPSRGVQAAPTTQPAPPLRAEPITNPARILQAITQASPTRQPAPITEPAPTLQAEATTQPSPTLQAAPITEPSPTLQAEALTEPTPVLQATSEDPAPGMTGTEADPASAPTVKVETLAAPVRPPRRRPTALLATAIGALLILGAVGAIWSTREKPALMEPDQAAMAETPQLAPSELLTAEPQAPKDAGVSTPKAAIAAPTAPSVPPSMVEIFVSPDVDVSLEGRALGRTPLTIPLAPGHYTLTLTDPARGLVRTARMIDITHDGTSTFRIRLGMGVVLVHAPRGPTSRSTDTRRERHRSPI